MEALSSADEATPPGLTFSYRPAEIQGLTADTASLAPPPGPRDHGATTEIQNAPIGIQLIPLESLEAFLQQQKGVNVGISNVGSPSSASVTAKLDPQRVRGRMTAYAFFVQERREMYRRQGADVQYTAFSKECSALWKGMSEQQKQEYYRMAEEDRDRYQKETEACVKPLAKDGTRRGRRKKEPGQPKRNMCAFLHFCSEKRPKLKEDNPMATVGEMAKKLSSAWKLMRPEQKRPYEEMAEKDKERYEQQKQAYEAGYSAALSRKDPSGAVVPGQTHQAASNSSSGYQQPQGGGGVLSPGQAHTSSSSSLPPPTHPHHHHHHLPPKQKRRKKDPGMPKRNMSAFMFFSLERRPEIKAKHRDYGLTQLSQALSEQWMSMNEREKAPYEDIARRDKQRYLTESSEYKNGTYVRPTGPTLHSRHVLTGFKLGSRNNSLEQRVAVEEEELKIEESDSDSHDAVELDDLYQVGVGRVN